jgi:hypothetical protein
VSTQWFCFDDSTTFGIGDTNDGNTNILNNGSGSVCTDNAYILFYKRRHCMRDEKWWRSHIDRNLFDLNDFHHFFTFYDEIEKRQQHYAADKHNSAQNKNKFIERYNNTNNINNNYSNMKQNDNVNSIKKNFRKIFTTPTISNNNSNNSSHRNNYYSQIATPINEYNEQIKPARLLNSQNNNNNNNNKIRRNIIGSTESLLMIDDNNGMNNHTKDDNNLIDFDSNLKYSHNEALVNSYIDQKYKNNNQIRNSASSYSTNNPYHQYYPYQNIQQQLNGIKISNNSNVNNNNNNNNANNRKDLLNIKRIETEI